MGKTKGSEFYSTPVKIGAAGIEYHGLPGVSRESLDGVLRLVQYGDRVTRARILSRDGNHAFLLSVNVGDLVAIKSGFGSGYRGEGSHAFSYALGVLDAHGVDIEEYLVPREFLERLDSSALTGADLTALDAAAPVRPRRWHDYIFEEDQNRERDGTLWREFPPVIPFAIVEPRLTDLALSFWEDPDKTLLTAYRRLEDIVRTRTGLGESGSQLFSQAFMGKKAELTWDGVEDNERVGRAHLFVGAFMAYRNRRAHRELGYDAEGQLREFLLLNELFHLEKQACKREPGAELGEATPLVQPATRNDSIVERGTKRGGCGVRPMLYGTQRRDAEDDAGPSI